MNQIRFNLEYVQNDFLKQNVIFYSLLFRVTLFHQETFPWFLFRKYFAVKEFSVVFSYWVLQIVGTPKKVSRHWGFSRRTHCPWTWGSPSWCCSSRRLSSWPWILRHHGFWWLPPNSWTRAARTQRGSKHHAVSSWWSSEHFELGLFIDNKVVSVDNVVGVQLLVGKLHLLRASNLRHLLVIIPQPHVGWGQPEVTM